MRVIWQKSKINERLAFTYWREQREYSEQSLNGYMIELFMEQLWGLYRWRGRIGDQVREVGARLCRVLWTIVRSLYFILRVKQNLFGEGFVKEPYKLTSFSKDH